MPSPVPAASSQRPRSLTAVAVLLAIVAIAALAWALLGRDPAPGGAEPRAASSEMTAVADVTTIENALRDGAAPVDVRTPEEYTLGHLTDARNMDLSANDFDRRIAALDSEAAYVVYCASGRRAAEAINVMRAAGFSGALVNGGGYDDLAAGGLKTVTGHAASR